LKNCFLVFRGPVGLIAGDAAMHRPPTRTGVQEATDCRSRPPIPGASPHKTLTDSPAIPDVRYPSALAAGVAVLLLTAGCVGLDTGSDSGPTESPIPTSSTTGETSPDGPTTTDEGTTTDAFTTTDPDRDVVAFADLSPEARSTFERLLEERSLEAPRHEIPSGLLRDEAEGFRHVRYEGRIYEVSWDQRLRGKTAIRDAGQVNESALEADARVVNYTGLSPAGKRLFDQGRGDGQSERVWAREFPEGLRGRYVRYRGDVYRLEKLHADFWWTTVRIRRVNLTDP